MNPEQLLKEVEQHQFPWVFWFHISYRPKWFSHWWKTKGANYIEMQVWVFRISIGMPWFDDYIRAHYRDYGTTDHIRKTNTENLKMRLSFLVGRYL